LSLIDNLRGALFNTRSFRASRFDPNPRVRAEAAALEAVYRGCAGGLAAKSARRLLERTKADLRDLSKPERAETWIDAVEATLDMQEAPTAAVVERLRGAEKAFQRFHEADGGVITSLRLVRTFAMRIRGDVRGLRLELPELLEEARRRGDERAYQTMSVSDHLVARADGDATRLRARFGQLSWHNPGFGYHLQESGIGEMEFEADLYDRRWAALRARRAALRKILWSSTKADLNRSVPRI